MVSNLVKVDDSIYLGIMELDVEALTLGWTTGVLRMICAVISG